MRIISRETLTENMSATRSIHNFGTLLRTKPHKLGAVVQMKPDLSLSMLTEALRNVYVNPKQGKSSFTPINAMAVQWEIDVNYIKRVKLVSYSGDSTGGNPFTVVLQERYYDRNDTFALENRQQLFVLSGPTKLGTNKFEYTVSLVGKDDSRVVNTAYLAAGRVTRYRSNYFPELSERGFTKFLSNTEVHRNYLSRHRSSVDWSGDYAVMEDVYIADGKKDNETVYKLNKKEKDCVDHYLLSREQNLLWGESNFDINGKCQLQDEKGRDIPMGDGVIKQLERVVDKFMFSDLDTELLEDAMQAMIEKSSKKTGNVWTLICNIRFWNKFNRLMRNDLRFRSADGVYFWSKGAKQGKGGYIKVGATFDAYEFGGNTIVIMIDNALTIEYEEKAYAILVDATRDEVSGRPNIAMFTLEGRELLSGNLNGMGGQSGTESDVDLATSVDGSSYHLLGYSGVVVFNPYRGVIIEETIA